MCLTQITKEEKQIKKKRIYAENDLVDQSRVLALVKIQPPC